MIKDFILDPSSPWELLASPQSCGFIMLNPRINVLNSLLPHDFPSGGLLDCLLVNSIPAVHSLCPRLFDYQSVIQSVQSLSHVQLFAPWTAAHQASLSVANSRGLHKLMFIESVMPSSHLILCYPLILLPSIFPSIRVFSNESALRMRWPKYWSFSFSISPSNEHPGLISFRIDWLDLLAVQGTLSLLQHHSSKASVFQHSAFFIV